MNKLFLLITCLNLLACNSNQLIESSIKDENEFLLPPDPNPNGYDEIAFKQGAAGAPTKIVAEMEELIKTKEYNSVKEYLLSKYPGERLTAYLAIITLKEDGSIKLNQKELNQFNQIKLQKDSIYYRSGCTYEDLTTINNLIADSSTIMEAGWWMDDQLGKNVSE